MVSKDAVGIFTKQEGQDSDFYCRGSVWQCECGRATLHPHDRRLRVVEVEIERRKS